MRFKNMITVLCVALAMCLAVCGLTACGEESAKKVTVTIVDGETKTPVEIDTGKTVKDALDAAKITLGEKDTCEPKADAKITEDTKEIKITRTAAEIKVSLTVDGKTTNYVTTAATVQDFLNLQNITLGKDDEISAKTTDALTDGMKLTIKRVVYKEETKTEEIAFETEEEKSSSLAEGTTEVTQEGVKGEKTVTYQVKYVDGKEESREKVSEKVTKEPVKKIVTVGTGIDSGSDSGSGSDDSGSDDSGSDDGGSDDGGRTVVSRDPMPDCDEDGHGTYIVTYSDGSVEFEVY